VGKLFRTGYCETHTRVGVRRKKEGKKEIMTARGKKRRGISNDAPLFD